MPVLIVDIEVAHYIGESWTGMVEATFLESRKVGENILR